jgi:hypothetical protein
MEQRNIGNLGIGISEYHVDYLRSWPILKTKYAKDSISASVLKGPDRIGTALFDLLTNRFFSGSH